MNLTNICDGKLSRLDEFIEQVSRDAEYSKRKPIILWKRNRKPWIAILKWVDVAYDQAGNVPFDNYVAYGDWIACSLDKLLEETKKEFWFE